MTYKDGTRGDEAKMRVPVGAGGSPETIDSGARRVKDDSAGRMPPGTRIGPFVLEGVIGAGGMGVIYRARDEGLDRPVALKVLSDKLAADEMVVERFRREARSMAQLGSHPNIVQVLSAGREDEIPHFVMELVEGRSLDQRLEEGPVSIADAVSMFEQVVVALKIAHDRGILHRDIKPSNLMLTPSGAVKVLDFGLAKVLQERASEKKLTQNHEILGSPHYMSPEQAKGRPMDRRSDIYSLGATFYHILAGSPPFDDPSVLGILHKHISEPLPPIESRRPEVPPSLRTLLVRMLAKDPEHRPQDLDEVLRILKGSAGMAVPPVELGPRPALVDEVTQLVKHAGKLSSWDFAPLMRVELGWILLLAIVTGVIYAGQEPGPSSFGTGFGFLLTVPVTALFEWFLLRLAYDRVTFTKMVHIERMLFLLSIPLLLFPKRSVMRALGVSWICVMRFRAVASHSGIAVGMALVVALIGSATTSSLFYPDLGDARVSIRQRTETRETRSTTSSGSPAIPTPIPAAEKLINSVLDHAGQKLDELGKEEVK